MGSDTTNRNGSALASVAPAPPPVTPALADTTARELPVWGDYLAAGFPTFTDAVTGVLSADAYTIIRRTGPVAYPVRKLGTILSSRRLVAVPARKGHPADVQRAGIVQAILDRMTRLDVAIKDLVWGLVEGVIFGWITGEVQDGMVVPSVSVRRKAKAGGILEWDGQRVVQRSRPFFMGGAGDAEAAGDAAAKELPRHRVVVWQPGNDGNPEGDTELGWQLYQLAEEAQQQRKNRIRYADRHGLPWELLLRELKDMRSTKVGSALQSGADALKRLPHQGMSMSLQDIVKLVEPSGTTWQFLRDYDVAIAKEAHQYVLLNTLTSNTADTGPTGSSEVHGDQQAKLETAVARSMAQAFTSDLLPFVEFYNQPSLAGVGGRVRLDLLPEEAAAAEPAPASPADALALYESGVAVDAQWLYGVYGTTPPAGTPAVLKTEPKPAMPFGGGLPFGAGARREGRTARRLAKDVDAARHEVEAAVDAERRTLVLMLDAALPTVLAGGSLPPETADFLAQAFARLHLHGARSLRNEVSSYADDPSGIAGTAVTVRLVAAGLLARQRLVSGDQIKLADLAARYREIAIPAAAAATAALRERMIVHVAEFVEQGGWAGDHLAFRDWLVAQQPDFTEAYADLVLRNGLNRAYTAGRNEEYRASAEQLGLNRQIQTAGDNAVRAAHREYDGIVLPPGEQWDYLLPPFDHNCRCTMVVTDEEATPEAKLRALPVPPFAGGPKP